MEQIVSLLYSLLHKKILSIVESKRTKPTLLLDAFRYTQDKIFNTTIYWKCENRLCPGRAIQYGNLEERCKQQTLTLDEYLEKVMRLIGIKKYWLCLFSVYIFS
ncbi:unnamed protein product [Rotaria magnacalcarata]|uniref:FLYWCH-type domain-containing protein n=1 Tax=Rotaria magnacalcarata TaxID=392030 RepID=A0A816KY19_9BILA|nr:unnamed protein product [Rotaria magnacalcarata]CAF3908279.1 unnamed protein product [Rotaria magnacalcarata]